MNRLYSFAILAMFVLHAGTAAADSRKLQTQGDIITITSLSKRPNGDSHSFPSGHAGFALAQAGFLQECYGWRYGAPALVLAATVSYIRVDVDKHHWRDGHRRRCAGLRRRLAHGNSPEGDPSGAGHWAGLAGHSL